MKELKRYAIKTRSGKFLRLKYELSANIKETYEEGIEETECTINAIPNITFYLTEETNHTQIWTTRHKNICEEIIGNRFDFNYTYSYKNDSSIDKPFLEITQQELTKNYYQVVQIKMGQIG